MGWEIALMAIGTGLSAVGQIEQGRAIARQEEAAQRQSANELRQARIQALDEELTSIQKRRAERARNIAFAAANGADPFASGSFLAIKEFNDSEHQRDIEKIRLFGKGKEASSAESILASKAAASSAKRSSYLAAGSTLFSGGRDIYKAS